MSAGGIIYASVVSATNYNVYTFYFDGSNSKDISVYKYFDHRSNSTAVYASLYHQEGLLASNPAYCYVYYYYNGSWVEEDFKSAQEVPAGNWYNVWMYTNYFDNFVYRRIRLTQKDTSSLWGAINKKAYLYQACDTMSVGDFIKGSESFSGYKTSGTIINYNDVYVSSVYLLTK
ncbi:MAG: hypothetical protein QXG00_06140 [Candidatus Woesearchaeota archaeon]